jgi:hypothetical protein
MQRENPSVMFDLDRSNSSHDIKQMDDTRFKPHSRRKPIALRKVFPPVRLNFEDIEAVFDIFVRHGIEVTLEIDSGEYEVYDKVGIRDVHKKYLHALSFY